MTKADLHQLVDALPEEAVDATARLIRQVIRGQFDPDQAWFWTREWQDGEREANEDLEAGRYRRFDSDDAFLVHLESVPPAPTTPPA